MDGDELIDLMKRQRGGRIEAAFEWIAKIDPEYLAAFNQLTVQAFGYHEDGSVDTSALSPKVREFIAIAILSAQRDWERLPTHLNRLIDLGATDKEMLEVFQTAGTMTGGPAMRGGVTTLMELRRKRGGR